MSGNGRPDYDAGDLVVYAMESSAHPIVRPGKVFRVVGLFQSELRGLMTWGVSLENVQPRQPHQIGFPARYFRRIDPKPPEFWTGTVDADAGEKVPA